MNKKARISYVLIVGFCIILSIGWAESRKQYAVTSAKSSYSELDKLETVTSANPKPVVTKKIIKKTYYKVPISKQDQDFIKEVCKHYGFSPKLIYQIMFRESSFNIKSDNGTCKGIMQLHKNYYKTYLKLNKDGYNYIFNGDIGNFEFYNLRHSFLVGIRMLDSWRNSCRLKGYTDIESALQCYHDGTYGYLEAGLPYGKWVISANIKSYVIEEVKYEKSIPSLR